MRTDNKTDQKLSNSFIQVRLQNVNFEMVLLALKLIGDN